jgi:hypothetical protein
MTDLSKATFALRSKLYIGALQQALKELTNFKAEMVCA